ncbi:putative uncharacterized phage protein [Aliivibrio wodanis]|uniref:Uncharacterized phage protein n=1 Tax=Aliivibrio wodanis TaxID=80852 RepID=A0A090K092_9GAMM|nr:putative uncharacterized phage protein [Aliivibrio wodanis]
MASITQQEQLEILAKDLKIVEESYSSSKSIHTSELHGTAKYLTEIYDIVEHLERDNNIPFLYELMYEGLSHCNTILERKTSLNGINELIHPLKRTFLDALQELNIKINIEAFQKNTNLFNEIKNIEVVAEEAKNSLSNIIYQTEAKLQAAYDNNKTAEEHLKSTRLELEKSNKKIDAKITKIDTELDEIKLTHINEANNNFTSFNLELDNLKENTVSNAITEIQTRLVSIEQDSIRRQTKQYSERLSALKEIQNGALEKFNGEVDDQIDNISNRINKEISAFETKKLK